jgi:hypothetical protein
MVSVRDFEPAESLDEFDWCEPHVERTSVHNQSSCDTRCVPNETLVADQRLKSEALLRGLEGELMDAITLKSSGFEEAGFLSGIVSKLSPLIANRLEKQICDMLNTGDEGNHRWIRQDPDFPDVLLLDEDGESTGFGYEVKAWYVMSTEITGRFKDSLNLLASKQIQVAVVAWHMSDLVFGQPRISGVYITDALGMAAARDRHYHRPPDYVLEEPGDTTDRTQNLQQSNVAGYKWQETDSTRLIEAKRLMAGHAGQDAPSHSPEAQRLVVDLMSQFNYRTDTNFAKIDRIDHGGLEEFKEQCLETPWKGKTFKDWRTCFRDLNKRPDSPAGKLALRSVQPLYQDPLT